MSRIDRFLSEATGASRRDVRKWLRAGRVCVDGEAISDAGAAVAARARVTLDGEVIAAVQNRYLMLHKPHGTVCTARHADPRSVLKLLPDDQRTPLQCVGRLDLDTTGLLLITDDGDWNHRISRPGSTTKVYQVGLARPIESEAVGALLSGVTLRNESRDARAAWVDSIDAHTLRIAVLEGRYHLVRRMVAAVGNHVERLHREAVGGLELDPELAPGEWRALSESECALWDNC